jgi:hypothetical protein
MALKTRELLVRQATQPANALRAHLPELSVIAATGPMKAATLIEIARETTASSRFAQSAFHLISPTQRGLPQGPQSKAALTGRAYDRVATTRRNV